LTMLADHTIRMVGDQEVTRVANLSGAKSPFDELICAIHAIRTELATYLWAPSSD
jgi:hypothetical protein